jgi:hypothetical protein
MRSTSDSGWRGRLALAATAAAIAACDGPAPCPATYFDAEIPVPATSTVITYSVERFGAEIAPGPSGVSLSIADNVGTVTFDGKGPIQAFVYATEPYAAVQRTLYAGLGVDGGTWYPFWLYCDDAGHLTTFYGEMTDRDRAVMTNVSGTCARTGELRDLRIDVPAHNLSHVALTCGFSVSAPPGAKPIDLGSARAGSMDLAGNSATVLPFHAIDCRSGCGSPGWFELHSIVWDPIRQNVGFTIFYLDESGVTSANGILLPIATPLAQSFPNATWTLQR